MALSGQKWYEIANKRQKFTNLKEGMKAIKYSIMLWPEIHSDIYEIQEYFIPDLKLRFHFGCHNDKLYVANCDECRFNSLQNVSETIDLEDELIAKIQEVQRLRETESGLETVIKAAMLPSETVQHGPSEEALRQRVNF